MIVEMTASAPSQQNTTNKIDERAATYSCHTTTQTDQAHRGISSSTPAAAGYASVVPGPSPQAHQPAHSSVRQPGKQRDTCSSAPSTSSQMELVMPPRCSTCNNVGQRPTFGCAWWLRTRMRPSTRWIAIAVAAAACSPARPPLAFTTSIARTAAVAQQSHTTNAKTHIQRSRKWSGCAGRYRLRGNEAWFKTADNKQQKALRGGASALPFFVTHGR